MVLIISSATHLRLLIKLRIVLKRFQSFAIMPFSRSDCLDGCAVQIFKVVKMGIGYLFDLLSGADYYYLVYRIKLKLTN